jgi:carbonic anhydrase/acetyltransferase-like protein (isoleucine patch superfamily)
MTVLVCRVNVLPKVHIPLCAIIHGCEVEEHVIVAICMSSLIVNHFHVLLKSQLFINFSSHIRMLHFFQARPPWFYLSTIT